MNPSTLLYSLAAAAFQKEANYPLTPLGQGGAGGTPYTTPALPKPTGAPVTGSLGAQGTPGQAPALGQGGASGTPYKVQPMASMPGATGPRQPAAPAMPTGSSMLAQR